MTNMRVRVRYDLKLGDATIEVIYVLKTHSLFSRLLHVQLSKPYQFKITIREIFPANIKLFALEEWPQSYTNFSRSKFK